MEWDHRGLRERRVVAPPVHRQSPQDRARSPLARLQQAAGNAAVAHLLAPSPVQRAPADRQAPPAGALAAEQADVGDLDGGAAGAAGLAGLLGEEAAMGTAREPVLARGANGPDVSRLQQWLAKRWPAVAIDGSYGPQTAAFVCLLQLNTALTVDGVVGEQTWNMMDEIDGTAEGASPAAGGTPQGPATAAGLSEAASGAESASVQRAEARDGGSPGDTMPARTMTLDSVGADVAMIQTGLNLAYADAGVAVDGRFGETTRAFVLLYQVDHGLVPDGVVGPETRKHLDPVVSMGRKVAASNEIASWLGDLSEANMSPPAPGGQVAIPGAIAKDIATLAEKDF